MDFTIATYKKMLTNKFLLLIFALFIHQSVAAENHVITLNISHNDKTVIIIPHLSFNTSNQIKEAIDNGIRIQFIAKAQIYQPNSWWFDDQIADSKINLEVSFFTLGKLYIVKNKETGEQLGFNDYEQLWKEFEKLMRFEYAQSVVQDKWFKMRIMLDKGALPTAMQLPVLFDSNWDVNTPWYEQQVDNK
jgi:hypothetical protein